LNKLREKVTKEEQNRKQLEEHQSELLAEKQQLFMQLQREQDVAAEAQDNVERLLAKKSDLENNIQVIMCFHYRILFSFVELGT